MFVGEIEFSDIPISTDSPTWPLGYLYLLTFIFLIVVVLMNLLNGLAVSDTAVIQDKAEIVTYIIRVETIASFEAVLLGDPFNFLANWPAIKVVTTSTFPQSPSSNLSPYIPTLLLHLRC